MKLSLLSAAASLLSLATVFGCTESPPTVSRGQAVHKTLAPGRLAGAAKTVASRDHVARLSEDSQSSDDNNACQSSGSTQQADTQCSAWSQDINNVNQATGDFEYLSSCADDGGDIASIHTVGHQDPTTGIGTYVQTYNMRDGTRVIWNYTYHASDDGVSEIYDGTSSDGTVYSGTYRYPSADLTVFHEVYTLPNGGGVSTVDGSYDAQQRFTGTQTWDDPATADNPDSTLVQTQNDDGLRQEYTYLTQGWTVKQSSFYPAAGGLEYSWRSDDSSTTATPDYDGSYTYAADGSGTGSYVQKFDDGSSLNVSQVIAADGSYDENWVWHDASTEQDVDQTGSVHYAPCSAGVGTVTTFVEGGNAETCDLHVALDGTTTTDNCH